MPRNTTVKLLIVFLAAWLSTTLLVDFMVIPGAFRQLGDLEKASRLGLFVFSTFNKIEVILAILILACSWSLYKKGRARMLPALAVLLFSITVSYLFVLTPAISRLRQQRVEAQAQGGPQVGKIKSELMTYHRLYVSIDAAKMILLTGGLVLCFFYRPKEKRIFGKSSL